MKVEAVHFLIHPGFCSEYELSPRSKEWGSEFLSKDNKSSDTQYLPLREAYVDYARSLREEEILLVFSHLDLYQLTRTHQIGKSYVQFLKKLKRAAGSKLIFFSNECNPFSLTENWMILGKLRGLGLEITKEADSYALGETLRSCVADGARSLNITLGLVKPTVILPHLTEMGIFCQDKTTLAAAAEICLRGRDRIILQVS